MATWHALREFDLLVLLLMLIFGDKHPDITIRLLFSYTSNFCLPCFPTPTASHTFYSRATNERSTQYPKRVLSKFTLSSATESRRSQRACDFCLAPSLNGNFSDSAMASCVRLGTHIRCDFRSAERQCRAHSRASHANFRTRLPLFFSFFFKP